MSVITIRQRFIQPSLAILLLCALVLGPIAALGPRQEAHAATAITGLHVVGNKLVNGAGQEVRVRGVNRAGTEYACIQGWGFFDGPSDAASVQAIASWKTNAVRVLLNEQCWLGVNTNPAYGGANYQTAIKNYVNLLTQNGLIPIVELQWNAPAGQVADGLRPMPDRDYSPEFWRQVASTFKGNSSVVFDLFNEPYPDNNQETTEAWRCWRDGGTCSGVSYQAAGMQELVNAVRGTGATNPLMLSGVQYAAGLSRWLEYKPSDPQNGLIASWHMYPYSWHANDTSYWDTYVAKVASTVPLVAGEIGQTDCGTAFLNKVMAWLDNHVAGYNAWTWNAWGGCESLITSYGGAPTQPYGQAYKDHLAAVAAAVDTTAPTVSASPGGGTYSSAQTVSLTASEPATTYYTTDGSTPTTSSAKYAGSITVGTTTALKFTAVDQAGNKSPVSTETYTIETAPSGGTLAAPASLSAVSSGTLKRPRLDLSWTDNSSNEAKFVIERSTSSGFSSNLVTREVGANTVSYRDTSVQQKTTYYYRVFAASSTGARSVASNVASSTTR